MRRLLSTIAIVTLATACTPEPAPEKKVEPAPPPAKPGWVKPLDDAPFSLGGDGKSALDREQLVAFARLVARDLKASERFASDVLDVRAIQDRSDEGVPTGELEEMIRGELANTGLRVLARLDPREPERAAVAIPLFGFVDAVREAAGTTRLFLHLEAASEAPGAVGPGRVVWARDAWARVKPTKPSSAKLPFELDLHALATSVMRELEKELRGEDAFEVQPPTDRTERFPVLAFDAALRTRLVRRGLPVAWRRAAGVDAPPSLASGRPPVKNLDLMRLRGEVEELPGGGGRLVLRVERWAGGSRWENFGAFEHAFAK